MTETNETMTKVRVPNGLMEYLQGTGVVQGSDTAERPEVAREVKGLKWGPKGAVGEVGRYTLGWLVDAANTYTHDNSDESPSALRAGRAAAQRFAEAYEALGGDQGPEQGPEQDAPELGDVEHQDQGEEPEPVRVDRFEEGRRLGMDHGEAHDYAKAHERAERATESTQEQEPQGAPGDGWKSTAVRAIAHELVGLYRDPEGEAVKVSVRQGNEGVYRLLDLETDELIATLDSQDRIWWAPMPMEHYYGKPVYHTVTGALVGYWTMAKFTPIGKLS